MRIRNIFLWVFIFTLCFQSIAQTGEGKISVNEEQKIWSTDSIGNRMADTLINENLNMLVSDKLDSLVNTWYIQNAFAYQLSDFDSLPEELKMPLPDSVYISRLQSLDSYIPLPYNETVRNFIGLYTIRKRELTSIMLGLSNYYFPLFEEALERYQLPHELKYLPIIESALNPKAFSRAGASGLWQFMVGTGKMYGLEVNSYIDERNDPIKASDAAARYLKDLYAIYGDWHMVIAAYNCGPGNINKAVRRTGGKQNYWDIYYSLPRETRGYIPVFIAAVYVMNYYQQHSLTALEPKFKAVTDTLELHNYLNFAQLSAMLNISIDEIRQLNPQYRRDVIPAKADKPYLLKLPSDQISTFIDRQDQIFAYNRDQFFPNNQLVPLKGSRSQKSNGSIVGMKEITHIVKRGDNLGAIAGRYRVSIEEIKEWNNLRKKLLQIGQRLSIYVPDKTMKAKESKVAKTATTESQKVNDTSAKPVSNVLDTTKVAAAKQELTTDSSEEYIIYTVQSGDSLFTIAKKFPGITDADIRAANNIRNVRGLMPGQTLRIPKRA